MSVNELQHVFVKTITTLIGKFTTKMVKNRAAHPRRVQKHVTLGRLMCHISTVVHEQRHMQLEENTKHKNLK